MPVINPNTGEVQAYLEGDEGIINKRSMRDNTQYSFSGTPSQIASKINQLGGGVAWANGATYMKYENGGYLGANLQPPIFNSYYENRASTAPSTYNTERLDRIEQSLGDLAYLHKVEASKKVIISTREYNAVNREYEKQTAIATL